MAYQVNHTETTNPAKPPYTVQEQSLNTETSLTFPGKNYSGYAPIIAENFLHLLENFAGPNKPSNPVQGQLWYDNNAGQNLLKVFDGTNWTPAGIVKKSDTQPAVASSLAGDIWVDTTNQQLYVYSGSNWLLVGPQFSSGLKTGPDVEIITDTGNVDHSVISFFANNNRMAIISKEAFTPKTSLAGFPTIGQGFNLTSVDATNPTTPTKLWGTASGADALNVSGTLIAASNFLRSDQPSTTNYPVYVLNSGGVTVGTDKSFQIYTETNSAVLHSKTSGNYIEVKLTNAGSPVIAVHIDATGKVGVGPNNTAPQQALDVAGNIVASGNISIEGTTDASQLGTGSITTAGGLSVEKSAIINGNITTFGALYFNNLDSNLNPIAGSVLMPGSDDASQLYDLGSDTRQFRNIYAQNFVGAFNGNFTGTLSGNVSGSSAKLASPTRFRIRGDFSSIDDVVFDGQLQQNTSYNSLSGYQVFQTSANADLIDLKTLSTNSLASDHMLVTRNNTLYKVTKQTFISNIPTVPIGAIMPFAGNNLPSGYLFCDGSEVTISAYPDLFAVIGYTYKGVAQLIGKATFALPDLRGRFPLGRDNMDNTNLVPAKDDPTIQIPAGGGSANRVTDIVADTLGAGTGDNGTREYITLDVKNLPDHKHNLNSGNAQYYAAGLPGAGTDPAAEPNLGMPQTSTGYGLRNSGNVISSTIGQGFNAMNPYATINYIIFTGAI